VSSSKTLTTMRVLQRCLEGQAHPRRHPVLRDYAPEANRFLQWGHPKWSPIDRDDASASAARVP